MDKATLLELKDAAEKRCNELAVQAEQIRIELERSRGDYRTLDSLLLSWVDGENKKSKKEQK